MVSLATRDIMRVRILMMIVAAIAQPLGACDLCAIYAANEAQGEAGSGFFAGAAEQFTHFGTVQVDGRKVANPSGQYLDSSISQLFAGYNLHSRLSLQFNLPVIYRSFKRPDGLGGIERGTESGIGDGSLVASFVPYRKLSMKSDVVWNVLAGVKFPTGSSDRIREEFNEVEDPVGPPSGIHGHDLTLGTGSYDGIIGTGVYARWGRGFGTASVQYAIRSEGDFNYRFANDLTWSGGPGVYLVMADDYTITLQAVVSGEDKGTDTFRGVSAPDTGVTAVYLGPQINFTWGTSLSAQVGVDLPVSIHNTALQTVADYRVRAAFTWRF
jgi:hypothetical protein